MTSPQDIQSAVLTADTARRKALVAGDWDGVEKYVTHDLMYTHGTGRLENRQQYFDALRTNKTTYLMMDARDVIVHSRDKVAWLNGKMAMKIDRGTGTITEMTNLFLATWIEEGGAWKLAAYQATPQPR